MAPLSAAKKQRRYRARRDADPERRQEYLNKEKEKWRKGRKKKVSDFIERETKNTEKEMARQEEKAES